MAESKKAVDLEALQGLKQVFATKAEVAKQIEDVQLAGSGIEFATTEEVLALFRETASGDEA